MAAFEKFKIAEALEVRQVEDGHVIVNEGDAGWCSPSARIRASAPPLASPFPSSLRPWNTSPESVSACVHTCLSAHLPLYPVTQ